MRFVLIHPFVHEWIDGDEVVTWGVCNICFYSGCVRVCWHVCAWCNNNAHMCIWWEFLSWWIHCKTAYWSGFFVFVSNSSIYFSQSKRVCVGGWVGGWMDGWKMLRCLLLCLQVNMWCACRNRWLSCNCFLFKWNNSMNLQYFMFWVCVCVCGEDVVLIRLMFHVTLFNSLMLSISI